MFDTQSKRMEIGEYIVAVKAKRKKLDGHETYGKWTRVIQEHYNRNATASVCAHFISMMALDSER